MVKFALIPIQAAIDSGTAGHFFLFQNWSQKPVDRDYPARWRSR
jgi:hypothetical protein